jgi:hypothetical protein
MGDSEIKRYKKMAEHCERPADVLPNIEMKRQFKERAQRWRDLAKHAFDDLPPTYPFLAHEDDEGCGLRNFLSQFR